MRDSRKPTTSGHVFKRIHKGSGASRLIGDIIERADTGTGRTTQTLGKMLGDFGLDLSFSCVSCGHAWTPPAPELIESFGAEASLSEVRVPCPACGGAKVSAHPVARKPA